MSVFQQMPKQIWGAFSAQQREIILSTGSLTSLRAYSTLREDVWKRIDDRVQTIARERLNGIADLEARGLTQPLGDLGTQVTQLERAGDFEPARQVMRPNAQGRFQQTEFDSQFWPVPVTFSLFSINIRDQLASQNRPETLELTGVDRATRAVAEKLEDTLFKGGDVTMRINGANISIPGYTNFSSRATGTLAAAWDNPSDQNYDPIGDVKSMLEKAYGMNSFGPFYLYVSKDYWAAIQDDYKAESDKTILERIEDFADIERVRPGDRLPNDTVVLVEMTTRSLDLGLVEPIQVVELQGNMFDQTLAVFACMVPRVKDDMNGNCGIVHFTAP